MAIPVISWYDETHATQVSAPFDFSVVDAGDVSNIFTFNIWNNRGGSEDVSKMEDCTITTRDMSGGLGNTVGSEVQLVAEDWMHAQIDSLGETDIADVTSAIGANASKPVGTTGSTSKDNAGTVLTTPLTPASQEILGVNNNGVPADSAGNFVTISFQAEVPLSASAGRQDFKLRLSYRYV